MNSIYKAAIMLISPRELPWDSNLEKYFKNQSKIFRVRSNMSFAGAVYFIAQSHSKYSRLDRKKIATKFLVFILITYSNELHACHNPS